MARYTPPNYGPGISGVANAGQVSAQSMQLLQRGIENLGRGITSLGVGIANKRQRGIDQSNRDRAFSLQEQSLAGQERARQANATQGLVSTYMKQYDMLSEQEKQARAELSNIEFRADMGNVDPAMLQQAQANYANAQGAVEQITQAKQQLFGKIQGITQTEVTKRQQFSQQQQQGTAKKPP